MAMLSGVGYLDPAEYRLKATVPASVQRVDPDFTSFTFEDCCPEPDADVGCSFAYRFFALSSTTAVTSINLVFSMMR